MMDARAQSLLAKLQSFPLDEPGASRPFSARLRKENGWNEDFTRRAINEYRRFLVLAAIAGHRVSPSKVVDEVWHLHLLYTRSYWDELCGKVLGFPLHHEPSRGPTDGTSLAADYMRTLSSYNRLFGELPPPDLWPSPHTPPRRRKPTSQKHSAFFTAAAIATPFSLPIASAVPGPLSMTGPTFLLAYLFAAPTSALLAIAMRRVLAGAPPRDYLIPLPLEPADIAYLRGGPMHTVDVTLVGLVAQRRLVFNTATNRIEPDSSNAPLEESGYRVEARVAEPTRFERAILKRVGSGITLATLRMEAANKSKEIFGTRLVTEGLVHDERRAWVMFWLPIAVALVFPVLGVVRIVMGIFHERPVGLLVMLSIVWGLMLYGFFRSALFTRPHLTKYGAERLNTLEVQHQDFVREPPLQDIPLAAACESRARSRLRSNGPSQCIRRARFATRLLHSTQLTMGLPPQTPPE